ncbi:serine hydrolase domain-containing protein [Pseudarthrobacter sp. NPDC089323]
MKLTANRVQAGFEPLLELFTSYSEQEYEAQLAVYVQGELVVDLATGIDPDALMTVYSSSKGLSAFALALLVDRGLLDLNEPVSAYWPEFAQAGKEHVTVRQLLSHQAGLPEIDGLIPEQAWVEHHHAAELLARQEPFWRPGSAFGYHSMSLGALIDELSFRTCGKSIQELFEHEVRQPAQADAFLGLPASLDHRVVDLQPMILPEDFAVTQGPYGQFLMPDLRHILNSEQGRRFGPPAGGGMASARGLAKIYQWATGYGTSTSGITAQTLRAFAQTQVAGYDQVLEQPIRSYGIVFEKSTPVMNFGSPRAFGHDGAGGSMAFADPYGEICFGYTVRRTPFPGGMDQRAASLAALLRAIVG